jgi:hypothetical protein
VSTIVHDEPAAETEPASLAVSRLDVCRTPPTIHLKTAGDLRLEMARVYRAAKVGDLCLADATKLVYILSQIGRMVEVSEVAARVEAVERVLNQRKKR